ncbi:hypothetical protein OB955_09075 [Halobacteria archaeon AArc-m2/3/4]|uniref:Uncharacterized protein n=1 Tax=Natronoglomus mannanivorans TaxID=2979990 RepID=A0ABT2QD83_9EURY|nr:hypothetical protein [Halobacteria archaeon AArc-m2/3/4]
MSLCVKPEDEEDHDENTTDRRRIDVTDMHAAGVQEYVRDSVTTDRVSLEHRAGRTYLVLEE